MVNLTMAIRFGGFFGKIFGGYFGIGFGYFG
jgi:hypothetical protein